MEIDGETVQPPSTESISIEPLGVMRRWRLATVRIESAFFSVSQSGGPTPAQPATTTATTSARLRIEWDGEARPSRLARAFRGELDESWGWGKVGVKLLANPEGLSRFAIQTPALRTDLIERPDPLIPNDLKTGARARLRVRAEGLFRIDLAALAEKGFAGETAPPGSIRLFYAGRPWPLLRRGVGESQDIYFWNPAPEGLFSPDRVYGVVADAGLPDPAPDALRANRLESTVIDRTTTIRTARLERDNELVIDRGEFLMILGMGWRDAPLSPDQTIPVSLKFDHFIESGAPLAGRMQFHFQTAPGAAPDSPTSGLSVAARAGQALVAGVAFKTLADSEREFELASSFVQDGMTSFGLTLAGPRPAPPVINLWFDHIEVDYPSEARLVEGRLTLRADEGSDLDAPVYWTPLPEFSPTNAPVVLAIQSDASGRFDRQWRVDIEDRDGEAGLYWNGPSSMRVEIRDPAVVPAADRFDPILQEDLVDPSQGADSLIIADAALIAGSAPIAERHRREGLKTRVVDVASIYDAFNHGESSPDAIRAFLAYTLAHWERGAPSYVLLVGDCSADYLGIARNEIRNHVPSHTMIEGDNTWASDEWFTMVAGDDALGDFMLGRVSVNSVEDLRRVTDKINRYENDLPAGAWQSRATLIADKDRIFPVTLDEIRASAQPASVQVDRIYLHEISLEDNWYVSPEQRDAKHERDGEWWKVSGAATSRILDTFNQGAALATYFGHGAPNTWSKERIWFGGDSDNSDNLLIDPTAPPVFMINLTCNSGAIDYPVPRWNINVTEDMIRQPGGAIASFVPSGPGLPTVHDHVARSAYRTLFESRETGLGEFSVMTKTRFLAKGEPETYAYMYVLLGDPVMDLRLNSDQRSFDLPRSIYAPGETIELDLKGIRPRKGTYELRITDALDKVLWRGNSTDYTSGGITASISLDPQLPDGPMELVIDAQTDSGAWGASAPFALGVAVNTLSSAAVVAIESGRARLGVEIENTTAFQSAEDRIEISGLRGDQVELLTQSEFRTDAGETRSIEFEVDLTGEQDPAALEVRLIRTHLPRSNQVARHESIRLALPPGSRDPRISRELTSKSWQADRRQLTVGATAVSAALPAEGSGYAILLTTAQGDLLSSRTLAFSPLSPLGALAETPIILYTQTPESIENGVLRLVSFATGAELDSLPIAQIRSSGAQLRIVPGSVIVSPDDPSEGETIFVDFEVENTGDATSAAAWATLYAGDPDAGGEAVYVHSGTGNLAVRPIAPGRAASVRLRWDAVKNAGERCIWIRVKPSASDPPMDMAALTATECVTARQGVRLAFSDFRALSNQEDRRFRRAHLYVIIANEGGTDARNVAFSFYSGSARDEDNLITNGVVPRIEAGKAIEVKYEWNYAESPPRIVDGKPDVNVQVHLKGSRDRLTSGLSE